MINLSNYEVIIPTVTSLIAGLWILKDFLLQRKLYPKIEIKSALKINCQKDSSGKLLGFISLKIKNSGDVRFYLDRGLFSIRYMTDGDTYTTIDIGGLKTARFPSIIAKDLPIFPENWKYSYVDSHSETNYNFALPIPDDAKILMLEFAVFFREKRSDFIKDISFYHLTDSGKSKKIDIWA